MKLKIKKGKVSAIILLGSLILLSIFTFLSLNLLINEKNTVQTKAQTSNLCPNNKIGSVCDPYRNGDWCIACNTWIKGTGKAYLCVSDKWTLPNPNGEPNPACGEPAPPDYSYSGGVVAETDPGWQCPGEDCWHCGTTLKDSGFTYWGGGCDDYCKTNRGIPCIKCKKGNPYHISPDGERQITKQEFGGNPGGRTEGMFTLPSCISQTTAKPEVTQSPPSTTIPSNPSSNICNSYTLQICLGNPNICLPVGENTSVMVGSARVFTNQDGQAVFDPAKTGNVPRLTKSTYYPASIFRDVPEGKIFFLDDNCQSTIKLDAVSGEARYTFKGTVTNTANQPGNFDDLDIDATNLSTELTTNIPGSRSLSKKTNNTAAFEFEYVVNNSEMLTSDKCIIRIYNRKTNEPIATSEIFSCIPNNSYTVNFSINYPGSGRLSNLITIIDNLFSTPAPSEAEITQVQLQEKLPEEILIDLPLENASEGVYTKSNEEASYTFINSDEVPWTKYTYYIRGETKEIYVSEGQTPPSQDMVEEIENL